MTGSLSCTVSLSMRINLGNYEHADCFISVSNVTPFTTAEEVNELLDGPARIAYEAVRERLRRRITEARSGS